MPEIDERIEAVMKCSVVISRSLARKILAALDACDREHPKPFEDVMEAATRWLEKVYPPDVPLVCDRDSPDPGPRLAAALRDCLEAQDVGAADSVAATDKKSVPSDRDLLRALATELDAIDHTHDVSDLFDAGLLAQYRDITGEGVTGLTTKAREAIRAAINQGDEQ